MKIALPLALLAGMAGAFVGFSVARARTTPLPAPSDSAPPSDRPAPAQAGGAPDELARAREEIASLKKQLEQRGSGTKALSREECAAMAATLLARKAALVEAKDGRGLLKLMLELAALGEEGYAGAMEIAGLLREDLRAKKRQFGIKWLDYFTALGGSMVPVMKWALLNADKAPPGFRMDAAGLLMWQDADSATAYFEALRTERDAKVAAQMARALRSLAKPGMAEDLIAAARAQAGNRDALRRLLDALEGLPGETAETALRDLAADADPALRGEAELRLTKLNPPAPGVLITNTSAGSQAELTGLQRGDVITSYDGNPVTSFRQLRRDVAAKPPDSLTTITVHRGDEIVTLQLKGGKIGIDGDFVKPK